MDNLQRVNLLIECQQRQAIEKLAHQKGCSVSYLVREYITQGMEAEKGPQQERAQALQNARTLKERIVKRRRGRPISYAAKIVNQMREARTDELLGRRVVSKTPAARVMPRRV
jgi:hypothetical protein